MSWKKHFKTVNLSPLTNAGSNPSDASAKYSNYSSHLPEVYTGHTNRVQRYSQYENMDVDSEVNSALDILSEFCTQVNVENGTAFDIKWSEAPSDNEIDTIKKQLLNWNNLNEFNKRVFKIFRNTLKYGDQVFIRDPETFQWSWVEMTDVNKVIVNESEGREIDQYVIKNIALNLQDLVATDTKKHSDATAVNPTTGYTVGKGNAGIVTIATNMAGRGTDIKINNKVKSNGGLAIVGTERHDSRRVDRQLRGRSGRQGDPGSSQFYVSLEDNLMRLFGSDRVAKMMDKMGLEEGEVIQHSMMTKTIERAQKKVEENNFGIRKRLLEYDDVMNAQREVVYKRRKHALEGNRLKVDIANMIYDTTEIIVEKNKISNSYKEYEFDIIRYFSLSSQFTKDEFEKNEFDEIVFKTYKSAYDHYNTKMKISAEKVFPIIKNVYQNPSNNFERIVVPFTDGKKTLNVVSDLKLAYESKGETLINDFEKNISLAIIDEAWKNHLRKMDELKQSVQLAVHEQKDPLIIYKFESFELFKTMLDKINREIISFLFKGELPSKDPSEIREDRKIRRKQKFNLSKEEVLNSDELASINRNVGQNVSSRNDQVETIVRELKKIGRNEKVTIKNITNGERKTLKYKVAENHLKNGDWILVND